MKKSLLIVLPVFLMLSLTGCGRNTVKPAAPARPSPAQTVNHLYLIALEDAGKSGPTIGCGDSLVSVEIPPVDLKSALTQLLSIHDETYGQSGLYNALFRSDLKVTRINRTGSAIEADLTGSLVTGGECDYPRVKAQLEAVLRQSTESKIPVTIRVNGDLLDDLLSGK